MNFTLNQFEVLTYIERHQDEKITQRDIASNCELSLGTVNKVLNELFDLELLSKGNSSNYNVTLKAYELLEPYKVKKAIFMAAGFGSRMVPVTLNTPKPLIKVHGKRIIETLLDAVIERGITDITIVRGYLGEQFDLLLKKYPMIKFIDNPYYNESNNISSALLFKDMLANAYVLESDLILYNKDLIRKYEYKSQYLGLPVEKTDDWCFDTKNGYIDGVKIGGLNCDQMIGISYWTPEDAKKMSVDIQNTFNAPGGKEKYWDEVSMKVYKDHYNLWVRHAKKGDIVEVDTYNELKQIDSIYNVL